MNDSGIYYYHFDNIGSVSAITDEIGAVISIPQYSVFGSSLSEDEERFGFAGKKEDSTGLKYFGARHYSSSTGRFLTVDPAKDRINWYSYV